MKYILKGALAAALASALSMPAQAFETEEYCDFSKYKGKGIGVQFSPLSMDNKRLSRERLGDREAYPHFFYGYNTNEPVKEKSIAHREAVIESDQFYRVNEGSGRNPVWARYYKTIVEDCSRIYLRIGEETDEFSEYWEDRGGMSLDLSDFVEVHGNDLSLISQSAVEKLKDLKGDFITLMPLRSDRKWLDKISEFEYSEVSPSSKEKMKVVKIIKKPFIYRGIKLAPLIFEVETENGNNMILPGYSHAIVKWESHQGKDLEIGVSEDVLIAKNGIPDRIQTFPVFKTDSGKVIIEDEVLKERIDDGSGINVSGVRKGQYIGYFKRYEYKNANGYSYDTYLFDLKGQLQRIRRKD